MPWAPNNGWEDSSWGVISGETGLDHTGAIVAGKSGSFVVTHGWVCWLDVDEYKKSAEQKKKNYIK